MVDTSSDQNQSQSKIEERIRWAKQRAKGSFDMYEYSIALEGAYEIILEKDPGALPKLEELVEKNGSGIFNTRLLLTIRDYIKYDMPPKEHDYYKQSIQNLEKGLEQLLEPNVHHKLFELYWDIRSGKLIPPDFNFYLEQIRSFPYFTGQRLDQRTTRRYAQEKAAYDYLYSHIKCLLSNPDEYMQHLKSGDLEDFVRESCKPIPS